MGFSTSNNTSLDMIRALEVLQVLMCFMMVKSKAKRIPLNSC